MISPEVRQNKVFVFLSKLFNSAFNQVYLNLICSAAVKIGKKGITTDDSSTAADTTIRDVNRAVSTIETSIDRDKDMTANF